MIPNLDALRANLGPTPRKVGLFRKNTPLDIPLPEWLENVKETDDPLAGLFRDLRRLWKRGVVRWGCVLRANADLYEDRSNDCPGDVIFSNTESDDDAWQHLIPLATRLHNLDNPFAPPPESDREREWREDLGEDMSFHLGFKLPDSWTAEGVEYRATTTIFHRNHLFGGRIRHRILPCLVAPSPPYWLVPVPSAFWPEGFADKLIPVGQENPIGDREAHERSYLEVFGTISSVFHETEVRAPHVDVYRIDRDGNRPFQTLVTIGMSHLSAPGEMVEDSWRHELIFYSSDHEDRAVEMLRNFAHYPWEIGQSISPWDTIPLGEHASSILGTPRFPILLFVPGTRPEDRGLGGSFHVGSHPVLPLMVVPITNEEFSHYQAVGPEAWLKMVSESEKSILYRPDRESLV